MKKNIILAGIGLGVVAFVCVRATKTILKAVIKDEVNTALSELHHSGCGCCSCSDTDTDLFGVEDED